MDRFVVAVITRSRRPSASAVAIASVRCRSASARSSPAIASTPSKLCSACCSSRSSIASATSSARVAIVPGTRRVAQAPGDRRGGACRPDARSGRNEPAAGDDPVEDRPALGEVAADPPEAPHAGHELQLARRVLVARGVPQRRREGCRAPRPGRGSAAPIGPASPIRSARSTTVEDPVEQRRLPVGAPVAQQVVGVLAHGLEQPIASVAIQVERLDEMVVDERDERVVVRAGHDRRGFQRASGREHRHRRQDLGAAGLEEVDAPGERLAEGLLAGRKVARTAGEHGQPRCEPRVEGPQPERSDARGGELDGQRQAVEPMADRGGDGPRRGIELERRVDGGCTSSEQLDGVVLAQWRDGIDVLARHVEDHPGRDDDDHARRRGEEPDQLGRRRSQVLDVVEQQELLATAQRGRQRRQRVGAGIEVERPRDRRQDERGVTERGQLDERRAVSERALDRACELECQPALAAAASAGQREQPDGRSTEQLAQLGELALAADERVRRSRERCRHRRSPPRARPSRAPGRGGRCARAARRARDPAPRPARRRARAGPSRRRLARRRVPRRDTRRASPGRRAFVGRVGAERASQLAEDLGVAAEAEVGVEPVDDGERSGGSRAVPPPLARTPRSGPRRRPGRATGRALGGGSRPRAPRCRPRAPRGRRPGAARTDLRRPRRARPRACSPPDRSRCGRRPAGPSAAARRRPGGAWGPRPARPSTHSASMSSSAACGRPRWMASAASRTRGLVAGSATGPSLPETSSGPRTRSSTRPLRASVSPVRQA